MSLFFNIFSNSSFMLISKNTAVIVFSNFVSKKVQETPVYVKRDAYFKISKKETTKRLEEIFFIRPLVAREIIAKCNKFLKIPGFIISNNYDLCLNEGISHECLQVCPEVLAEIDISSKIPLIKALPHHINITMPLLSLPQDMLRSFVKTENNRIEHIAKIIRVDKHEICKIFVRRPFLLTMDLKNIERNIKLLSEYAIPKEEIIKDLWVLRYSPSTIEKKLSLIKKNNVEIIKTWMVRAQPDILEKYIKRRSDNKSILGDNSLVQYLSDRLNCTEEEAKYIISKHPALQSKCLKKLNETIDFLFTNGFKPMHICRVPKILLHSIETTKKRLRELETLGLQLDSLYILTKSQKQYMHYYESHVKSNKNKLKNA